MGPAQYAAVRSSPQRVNADVIEYPSTSHFFPVGIVGFSTVACPRMPEVTCVNGKSNRSINGAFLHNLRFPDLRIARPDAMSAWVRCLKRTSAGCLDLLELGDRAFSLIDR